MQWININIVVHKLFTNKIWTFFYSKNWVDVQAFSNEHEKKNEEKCKRMPKFFYEIIIFQNLLSVFVDYECEC